MDKDDIYELFLSVAEQADDQTDAVREVFSLLVESTLRYRDRMLASRGITVTVEDVRTSLGWLLPSLAAGQVPQTDNELRLDLLKLWLDELKSIGAPQSYLH